MHPLPINASSPIAFKKYFIWFIGVFGYIGIWWLWVWPGLIWWDTAGYIQIGLSGIVDAWHSHLYSFIINALVIPTMRVSFLAGLQAALAALVLTRLYVLLWSLRPPLWAKIWSLLALLSPLSPMMAVFINADGIFAFTMLGLLFEIWLIAYRGKGTSAGWVLIACYTPLALFLRDNGKILALLLPLLVWPVYTRIDWIKLMAILLSCLVVIGSLSAFLVPGRHPVFLPMVGQEIAGFALPLPGKAAGENLSAQTKEALAQLGSSPEEFAANYHPYFWDYIGFIPGGPKLIEKSAEQVKPLIKAFFTRELWKNFPRFIGHRTEVFLAMSLAKGLHIDPTLRAFILDLRGIQLNDSKILFLPDSLTAYMDKTYKASYRHRWLFWNPLPAIALLLVLLLYGGLRNQRLRIILIAYSVQVVGVYSLAPSAEYRYLFPLFASLPLLLLAWKAEQAPGSGLACLANATRAS